MRKKTFSIIGDSISAFYGDVQPITNCCYYPSEEKKLEGCVFVKKSSQMWYRILENKQNLALICNNSYSGSPISNNGWDNSNDDAIEYSFVARCTDVTYADIIFIFGGTNDSWIGTPLGNYKYKDFTKSDFSKYRPSLAYVISTLQKMHPQSSLLFINNEGLGQEYTKSNCTVCKYYGVPLIQLYNIEMMHKHPTTRGMIQIACEVDEFLNNSVKRTIK